MYVNGRHWNTRKLVFAGTRTRGTRTVLDSYLCLCERSLT